MIERRGWLAWLQVLWPTAVTVDRHERWGAARGALIGVGIAGALCRAAAGFWDLTPWLMAQLGASAVLVFALPASPLAQPWSVLVGNTVSSIRALHTATGEPRPAR